MGYGLGWGLHHPYYGFHPYAGVPNQYWWGTVPVGVAGNAPYSVPSYVPYPMPTAGPAGPESEATRPTHADRAALHITVPDDNAVIYFDGDKMLGAGHDRLVMTPTIEPGHEFKFQVEATWTEDGKPVTQLREGTVTAGDEVDVDFCHPADQVAESRTNDSDSDDDGDDDGDDDKDDDADDSKSGRQQAPVAGPTP